MRRRKVGGEGAGQNERRMGLEVCRSLIEGGRGGPPHSPQFT